MMRVELPSDAETGAEMAIDKGAVGGVLVGFVRGEGAQGNGAAIASVNAGGETWGEGEDR